MFSSHNGSPSPLNSGASLVDVDSWVDTPPPKQQSPKKSLPPVTLILTNTGSVARDHLASERTWLSYVRTSLAVAGTGVALVQLFEISSDDHGRLVDPDVAKIQRFATPLGIATVFLGLYILVVGVLRYFRIQHALTQGQFPIARGTVVSITAALAGLVAVTFGVLVMNRRG